MARFHLGNGAILIASLVATCAWAGQCLRHDGQLPLHLNGVEENHEAFANDGTIVAAKAVTDWPNKPANEKAPQADRVIGGQCLRRDVNPRHTPAPKTEILAPSLPFENPIFRVHKLL